jgi:hypothetical protein
MAQETYVSSMARKKILYLPMLFLCHGKVCCLKAVASIGTDAKLLGMIDDQVPPLLSPSTRSESAIDFLVGKYQECRDKHIGCRLQTSPIVVYPSRVIDVAKSKDSIFLHDTQIFDERGPYACLSHCWGQKQPFMLTNETKSILHGGILVSALPKTFRDAVFVTRLLGVRFLWIDSL